MEIPFTSWHVVPREQTVDFQTGRSYEETILGFRKNTFRRMVTFAAIAGLIGGPLLLLFNPVLYTPAVQVLFAVGLSWAMFWLGSQQTADEAAQRANDRWLPQAESVILNLMTLKVDVIRLQRGMRKKCCAGGYKDLPELEEPEFKAVRIKITTECEANAGRLGNIKNHLDNAIGDWNRFVTSNCAGEECARIYDAQQQREAQHQRELQEDDGVSTTVPYGNEQREYRTPETV